MSRELRELAQDDLDALLDLQRYLHESDDPPPTRAVLEAVWKEICTDPRYLCAGLWIDDRLVASCTLAVVPNLTRGARPYAVIENVVSHGDFRRRGLGRAVIEHVLERAWARGCYKVMLLSAAERTEIHPFYESLGFDKHAKQGFVIRAP